MWNIVYAKTGDIVTRNIIDETILVPIRGKQADMCRVFSLNPVAEHIWRSLDGKKNLREIYTDISETYEVDPQELEADMSAFIHDLINEQLVAEVR
jgi:hypothetical protein